VLALRDAGLSDLLGPTAVPYESAWDEVDDASVVLAAFDGVRVRATMSATVFASSTSLSKHFLDGNPAPRVLDGFPACALRRAATCREERGRGLITLLRWHLFSALIRARIRYVVGSVTMRSARKDYFLRLGYRAFPEPNGWRCGTDEPTGTIVLDLERDGAGVGDLLEPEVLLVAVQWPLLDPIPDFRTLEPLDG
jgi:hypothetical protein